MRHVKYIVLHCTATNQKAKVSSIQNYWKTNLGWKSPGYHIIITAAGNKVRLAQDHQICNGVQGYNSQSLHVSYIGGIDANGKALDNRTFAQQQAMYEVVKEWTEKYPHAKVVGHRDFPKVQKECPSFDAATWWNEVNC